MDGWIDDSGHHVLSCLAIRKAIRASLFAQSGDSGRLGTVFPPFYLFSPFLNQTLLSLLITITTLPRLLTRVGSLGECLW